MELLRVIYHLEGPASEAEARAEALAREQTVEVPREALRDYQAYFTLSDGRLEIRWSKDFTTQRLERCG